MNAVELFLDATVRTATPLALAALGETLAERSGVINLGIEGALIGGAFGALAGATHFGVSGGLIVAIMTGVAVGFLFATLVVDLRLDQIVAGTAISMLMLGITGAAYRAFFGVRGAALTIDTLHRAPIPLLSRLPVIGTAVFSQPITTYVLYVIAPLAWWWMYRTHGGLALRACGESPMAARAAGIQTASVQRGALIFAGGMAGLAGSVLVLAQSGTFAEGMSAGRGFVAIAIVVLGRWNPIGVAGAAAVFGAASALQTLFQALGSGLPYQLFLALPYLLVLLALAVGHGSSRGPAMLGRVAER